MPYTEKQNALFSAAAHNPKIAKAKHMTMATARRLAAEGVKRNALTDNANRKTKKHA